VPGVFKWSLSHRCLHQNTVCTSPRPHAYYVPSPSQLQKNKKNRQCTCNVTLRRFKNRLLPWESNKYYTFLACLCASARAGECMWCVRARAYVWVDAWVRGCVLARL
jgi:hypothetical protein